MSSSSPDLKLTELAETCGVSPRTVRYYVQRGLLPAPVFRGRDTAYGEEHVVRLRAIKRLQEAYLPLDAIERELKQRPLSELREIAEGARNIAAGLPAAPIAQEASRNAPPAASVPSVSASLPGGFPTSPAPESPKAAANYQRFVLAPGLELHLSEDASDAVKQWAERIRRQS